MLSKTNIETQLFKVREKRISSSSILAEVHSIIGKKEFTEKVVVANNFDLNLLTSERIFHLQDIKKLCIDYRLRFLDAGFFKGSFPSEAISEIQLLEDKHQISLQDLKIVAPSKLLKLENADDPLLFAPIGDDYYYLVHKWGNDLHPLRKLLMWPYKSFENLVFTVFLISLLLTALTPLHYFTHTAAEQEYLLTFLFMFKAVAGIVLFYGFAKGKNFNTAIWDSKYYNA